MRIFHGFDHLPGFRWPAATVGSYDGVHGGHRELLSEVCRLAHEHGGESVVVTFAPHPRIVLEPATDLRLLTTLDEKAYLLDRAGIDNLVVVPFTREFSRTSPEDFIRRDLAGRLGVRALVMGYNHHFGRNKEGGYESSQSLYARSGMEVHEIGKVDVGGEKVSSTVVRTLVEHGRMDRAARLLNHPYLLIADVHDGRIFAADPYKLLPPPGDYPVTANGDPTTLFIPADGLPRLGRPVTCRHCIIEFSAI